MKLLSSLLLAFFTTSSLASEVRQLSTDFVDLGITLGQPSLTAPTDKRIFKLIRSKDTPQEVEIAFKVEAKKQTCISGKNVFINNKYEGYKCFSSSVDYLGLEEVRFVLDFNEAVDLENIQESEQQVLTMTLTYSLNAPKNYILKIQEEIEYGDRAILKNKIWPFGPPEYSIKNTCIVPSASGVQTCREYYKK